MKAAFYAWGGPGTIRLLKTKYFSPKIDEESFLRMYDRPFLKKAREIFGITDMFVTYSWGFSDEIEKEDRAFIVSRLEHFGPIRTYAYVQGFNVVYRDFSQDVWAKSPTGRRLLYSKGRAFTCPSNPQAVSLILKRVEDAINHNFFGIFIDNILFGIPPVYVYQNEISFFGCSCEFCQKSFKSFAGYSLPLGAKKGTTVIADYLLFRRETIRRVIQRISSFVRSSGKQFGVNLYDPYWHTSSIFFGYDLRDIGPFLDYFLFENHALAKNTIDNRHIRLHKSKPTFIVSYKKGIGRDSAYTQDDMNLIFSESQELGYIPCYKATEYKTSGVWHGLRIDDYASPSWTIVVPRRVAKHKIVKPLSRNKAYIMKMLNAMHIRMSPSFPDKRFFSYLFFESPLYTHIVKRRQYFLSLDSSREI